MSERTVDKRELLKDALRAVERMQARLEAAEQGRNEPIAIIGLGCRFPGGADSPDAYWKLLCDGVNAIREVPADRWTPDAYAAIDPEAARRMPTQYGGFLDQIDRFDPQFFGITPREAHSMDPQQRLVLEVCWEALEQAGQSADALRRSLTGVFVGITGAEYGIHLRTVDQSQSDIYFGTGTVHNACAGRVSYLLGLHGPSVAIDTACSSSLTAIHLACQSLRARESDVALAGGVNAMLLPDPFVLYFKWGMVAPDGRCKTFDAAADGFVRAEGCGMVVLKRLSDAIADGDQVLAVIRSSVVNQDGPSSGLTVPFGPAQEALLRTALQRAGIAGRDVGYVEAHGTGTSLGDPIELEALDAVLNEGRGPEDTLVVGSAKTNLGHLESAAGIAGLIKVVLSLQHGVIPPHLHFKHLSPRIALRNGAVRIPTAITPWPTSAARRIAGVSGFGFSGTNAHLIVEGAPTAPAASTPEQAAHVVTLSAKSPTALRTLARRWQRHLAANPALALSDLAFTSNVGRVHHSERAALAAKSTPQLAEQLEAVASEATCAGVTVGSVSESGPPQIAFLFTGQGSQYVNMGRALYDSQPTFRAALDRCDHLLRPELDASIISILYPANGESSPIDETAYTQPALFALEYALAELWRSFGIRPAAVLGHSVGEYVAACVAGMLSLEDAVRLIAARSRLMQRLPAGGEMAAILASEERIAPLVAKYADAVSIAAVNGPSSVVVSGRADAVRDIVARLAAEDVLARPLTVSHAFHSPLMDPMLDEFEQVAGTIRCTAPTVPLVSNVTGRPLAAGETCDAKYWRRHVRGTVRFRDGAAAAYELGCRVFLEIGPSPTLLSMVRTSVPSANLVCAASLNKYRPEWEELSAALGALYTCGAAIDWREVHRDSKRRRVALPTYPFERSRYWIESRPGFELGPRADAKPLRSIAEDGLLGRRIDSALGHVEFEREHGAGSPSFVADHRIFDAAIFPATAYLQMMLGAATRISGATLDTIHDVAIVDPLILEPNRSSVVQTVVTTRDGDHVVQIFSRAADGASRATPWRLHATGAVREAGLNDAALEPLEAARARCVRPVPAAELYESFASRGISYGPGFRAIASVWAGAGEALAALELAEGVDPRPDGYACHPGLLDGCFQALAAAVPQRDVYLPVSIERVALSDSAASVRWSHARLRPTSSPSELLVADVRLFNGKGQAIGSIEGLSLKRASVDALRRVAGRGVDELLYEVAWEPASNMASTSFDATGAWVILADRNGVGAALARRVVEKGGRPLLVTAGTSYAASGDGRREIDPNSADDFDRMFQEAAELGGGTVRSFVHLWSLDAANDDDSDAETIASAQRRGCGALLMAIQSLARSARSDWPTVAVVTRGAQPVVPGGRVAVAHAPIWALARTISREYVDATLTCVDLDPTPAESDPTDVLREVASGAERQIAVRQGGRYVARLSPLRDRGRDTTMSTRALAIEISQRGVLDNLQVVEAPRQTPGDGEVEIAVESAGLNFRDVLNALGMYPGDPGPLGAEVAGTVVAVGASVRSVQVGDRVLGMAAGGLRQFITTDANYVVAAPAGLTADEAATIPIAFLTADYALNRLAGLKAGERVLIHAAAGGVGLAAVQLAQRVGAEVFATAGTPEKRAFLASLGVRHVLSSRTLDFAGEIRSRTGGVGVDVVLNSLAGEFIARSVDVVARGGRFVEIGKTGIWTNEQIAAVRPDVAYHVLYLGDVAPPVIQEMLARIAADVASGSLTPLARRVFGLNDAAGAFRYMAQAKHIGKIVLSMTTDGDIDHRFRIAPDASYLVTGGLGALGLVVSRWLVDRGARHLVLVGRHEPSAAATAQIAAMTARGADVRVAKGDVSDASDVKRVLAGIDAATPLRGILHLAGVLDDGVILQQDWSRFERVARPKIAGAWNIHRLTIDAPLDFFVLFAAAAGVVGAAGQANYAAANAFLDALAHDRRRSGLPATSVDFGPWSTSGMAASISAQDQQRWTRQGITSLTHEQGIAALESALRSGAPQVAVLPVNWATFVEASASVAADAFFARLRGGQTTTARRSAASTPTSLREQVARLAPNRREAAVVAHIRQAIRTVVGADESFSPDVHRGLRTLGMDSLMAVELRNLLQQSVGRPLPATLAFDYPTIHDLAQFLLAGLDLDASPEPAASSLATAPARAATAGDGFEPIAIVGIGCRLPGGAGSPDEFWDLLHHGREGISQIPGDRWDVERFYDPDPDAPGKMYVRHGGFLDAVDRFDAAFFGVSPREATSLDPQQRLLLEVAWEALENAGQTPDALAGSRTGVFVGISSNDYVLMHAQKAPANIDAYFGTGNAFSTAAGRLSYTFGFQGPCLSIDTACSSSLVAVHLACQSLRSDECSLALVGGVNLILRPEAMINFSRARMLAADGRCKTFDAAADGYVRGEGAGVVVLKRLSDAQAAGDRIYAVVRGSAVNQDGRTSGLTVPNGPAQQALLRDALRAAGVAPADVQYVEAHGTGTALGDPIEVQALGAVFGDGRRSDDPLVVGSVKTNIGHLEAAAGVASIVKVALALRQEEIPPHLNFTRPNPHIALEAIPAVVPTAPVPWRANGRRRVAGVSAFGFSGTNAHVILEEAPLTSAQAIGTEKPSHLLALSAKSEAALRETARRLGAHLAANPNESLGDVAFTMNACRAHFAHRLALVCTKTATAQAQLSAFGAGDANDRIVTGDAYGDGPAPTFVFGDRPVGPRPAGRELYESDRTFADAVRACSEASAGELATPLVDLMFGGAGGGDDVVAADLSWFAIQYALAKVWVSWGLAPAAVTGSGAGLFAAACCAGVMTLADAVALVAARARAGTGASRRAFDGVASRITFQQPSCDVVSWSNGEAIAAEAIAQAQFWINSLESRSEQATAAIANAVRIEIASDSSEWEQMLSTLGRLYAAGASVNLAAIDCGVARRRLALPTYPFQRQRYWLDALPDQPSRVDHFTAIADAARRQSFEGPLDFAPSTYRGKWEYMDQLTTEYIISVFGRIGAFARAGEQRTIDRLVADAAILPVYRRLLRRWLQRLVGLGLLSNEGDVFTSVTPLRADRVAAVLKADTGFFDSPALKDYLVRCGTRLLEVLTGKESPLETLFPGGSFEVAEALYQNAPAARYMNAIVRAAVVAASQQRGDRPFRVLEIGAGSGGTTAGVLPALAPDRTSYWFTDVSDLFLNRARGLFGAYPFVRYRLLDIEKDPAEQGYPSHAFDVIVAANVIHATGDLAQTLERVKGLLAPGGALVLNEVTTHHGWFDITTSLIEGWQRYDDDVRSDNPLLAPEDWRAVLSGAGFANVVTLPGTDSPADSLGSHIVLASAPAAAVDRESTAVSSDFDREERPAIAPTAVPEEDDLVARLVDALPASRLDLLVEYVRNRVVEVLRMGPDEHPDRRHRLMDLGIDSLMAVDLRNRLAKGLSLKRALPATLIFDYPTIEAIAGFLLVEVMGRETAAVDVTAATVSGDAAGRTPISVAALSDLSEEEAEALLAQRLENIS